MTVGKRNHSVKESKEPSPSSTQCCSHCKDRIRNLERLLRKARKSEKFWKKLHTECVSRNLDLSLSLKWASKENIDYWMKMQKPMKGEWAIPEKEK